MLKAVVILNFGLLCVALHPTHLESQHQATEELHFAVKCADGEPPLVRTISEDEESIDCRAERFSKNRSIHL